MATNMATPNISADMSNKDDFTELSDVFSELTSSSKLERDKGAVKLSNLIKYLTPAQVSYLLSKILATFDTNDNSTLWERKHGSLVAAKLLLNSGILIAEEHTDFYSKLRHESISLLNDDESRLRAIFGEVLGAMCKTTLNIDIYLSVKDTLLSLIREHLSRPDVQLESQSESYREAAPSDTADPRFSPTGPGSPIRKSSSIDVYHDTAGWRCLETSMNALRYIVDGSGYRFVKYIDADFLELIFSVLHHPNRFVRETGYYLCSSLFTSCVIAEDDSDMENGGDDKYTSNPILTNLARFTNQLVEGLGDNWSQVRMAASVATRSFLMNMNDEVHGEAIYPLLIPCMCLNRYYIAEGVRIYSQETWRQIAGDKGRDLVKKYIKEVVSYYVEQTKADNHAVREAACSCIAELALKIEASAVRPHVTELLAALIVCFQDDSWPVRDSACLACGNFISAFPEECKPSMEVLYPMFFRNLCDNIPSVRQGAAVALGCVGKAYGSDATDKLTEKIERDLQEIKEQPVSSEHYGGELEKGLSTYGVIRQAMANDLDLHSNRTMYSCGSLAPKMRAGGCSDHSFQRPAEPWEKSDGCVYLMAELAPITSVAAKMADLLSELATAANDRHYVQHVNFLETVCKKLPDIGVGVGKRIFKSKLELFFDSLFYALSCENALTATAASQCLSQLATFLGPNILKGRVELYNSNYLEALNANIFSSPF